MPNQVLPVSSSYDHVKRFDDLKTGEKLTTQMMESIRYNCRYSLESQEGVYMGIVVRGECKKCGYYIEWEKGCKYCGWE